jgi:hypothetical protein
MYPSLVQQEPSKDKERADFKRYYSIATPLLYGSSLDMQIPAKGEYLATNFVEDHISVWQ